jgi:hypothetical protein
VPNAVTIITLLGLTWLSEKVKERSFIASIQNLWMMPCLIALRWWSGSGTDVWGTYALLVILLGYPYCHAILVAWTSRNAGSVRTRTISAAVYNMSVQAGGVIGSNIYRQVSHLAHSRLLQALKLISLHRTTNHCITAVTCNWLLSTV